MRIVACGSRTWKDRGLIERELALCVPDDIIVEGCAGGADRLAESVAQEMGLRVEHHPAQWALHGRSAGFKRNLEMLEAGCGLVIAFWDGVSRGTEHTVRNAIEMGRLTRIVYADGTRREFNNDDAFRKAWR